MKGWGQILEGPVCDAKEFGWYPGNDGKHFKFWMNVVRLIHAYPLRGIGDMKREEGKNKNNI